MLWMVEDSMGIAVNRRTLFIHICTVFVSYFFIFSCKLITQ